MLRLTMRSPILSTGKVVFYCAFREGQRHAGDRGALRIIVSTDGESWKSAGRLSHDRYDLRDAALAGMPDGRLMVLGGAQEERDGVRRTGTFVSFTNDGASFTNPELVVDPGRWLWRVTFHGDTAYGMSYGAPKDRTSTALLKTKNGLDYETVAMKALDDGERPTEARLRFAADSTAYCLHRRDGKTKNTALLGIAAPPYTSWQWHDLERRLGGPNFLQIPTGHWIVTGRLYDARQRTSVLLLNVDRSTLSPLLDLPSGGDTSYAGMVWHDDLLWVSYYSSHEDHTSVYLAKVRIEE